MNGAGFEDERKAIVKLFQDNWKSGGDPLTPVQYENIHLAPKGVYPYVRFTIVNDPGIGGASGAGRTGQITIGGTTNDYRFSGVIYISIFVAKGKGVNKARELADTAAAIFLANKRINILDEDEEVVGAIRFRSPGVKHIDPTKGGKDAASYQVNCQVPFERTVLL